MHPLQDSSKNIYVVPLGLAVHERDKWRRYERIHPLNPVACKLCLVGIVGSFNCHGTHYRIFQTCSQEVHDSLTAKWACCGIIEDSDFWH